MKSLVTAYKGGRPEEEEKRSRRRRRRRRRRVTGEINLNPGHYECINFLSYSVPDS
jgi:hypothetical protein